MGVLGFGNGKGGSGVTGVVIEIEGARDEEGEEDCIPFTVVVAVLVRWAILS